MSERSDLSQTTCFPALKLTIEQTIEELFDVVVLPNVRQPKALGLQGDDLQRLVKFPGSEGIIITKPTVKRPSIGETPPVAGLPSPNSLLDELPTSNAFVGAQGLRPDNMK